jgi:hypothetical protein
MGVNGVLSRIFGTKTEKADGDLRIFHNEEFHHLYSTRNRIMTIKYRRMRRMGHVACIGKKTNLYKVFLRKSEGKKLLGRPRRRWEYNIKTDIWE